MGNCVLALDQGTTSSRAIVFDADATIVSVFQQEFAQIYPAPAQVEHDPSAIWQSTLAVARNALQAAERNGHRVVAIGITNQRETSLVWDRRNGKPIHNAIVWQDRRTAATCSTLADAGHGELVSARTGLLLDPYFSATKIGWLLDHVPGSRKRAETGELAFGTVDSFLLWKLTGGRRHLTDATNASRTCLFDIHSQQWDPDLLALFRIPDGLLPEVRDCADEYGFTEPELFGRAIPIRGMVGDQQGALLGQACFETGSIKSTYGTGCFVVMNTGSMPAQSTHRLLTTVAWRIDGKVNYALEGSIFVAGAAVQWLRDGIGLLDNAEQSEAMARSIDDTDGVYLVPAFTGLGAPHWRADARGILSGLTRATQRAHIVRAALEATAYQTSDLLSAMAEDGISPRSLRVDGGMVRNNWLLQFLADIVDIPVDRPKVMETTALGAAYLAGRQSDLYGDFDSFAALCRRDARFVPDMAQDRRNRLLDGWYRAIAQV
ncbi:glycerol kinase GlpK [Oleiagrimonas sp.]|uniref:glycerol kinase GlpK n=1 Tax=Oleiagrimonas sp. TaxID=2010330 RepID=UPI002601821B|nr:glycerol kinase GlpK [Oleiagrimonas sp.]MDA3913732.1 glycerol kinase GlpK [Oleiagrimonas sp.]